MRIVRIAKARFVAAALFFEFVSMSASSAFADPKAEADAKAAMATAKTDYAAMNYGKGIKALRKALGACGPSRCAPKTRATLLMELGAMQVKKGAKDEAGRSFSEASKLQPGITFEPAFDSADARGALSASAKGGGGPAPDTSAAEGVPPGDFQHTPPAEVAKDTPLALYVDGVPDTVDRVIVKYKAPGSPKWRRIEMKKLDEGWGTLIPCGDITVGVLRYYIQGLDDGKTPVAKSGDPRHPYKVRIKAQVTGEAPHLPDMDPPLSCAESHECPPEFPDCSKSGEALNEGSEGGGEGDDEKGGGAGGAKASAFKRYWVGAALDIEFLSIPSGTDVCALDPTTGLPLNSNLYCTTATGQDFPTRLTKSQNAALCTQAQVASGLCPADAAGTSTGGLTAGNVRLLASFDYAFNMNLLLGARLGFTLNSYPGTAAVHDGRAFGSRFYGELRGTWVFGDDAMVTHDIRPIASFGMGLAEFDGSESGAFAYCPASQPFPAGKCQQPFVTGSLSIWQNGGPFFIAAGGGARWLVTDVISLTASLRLNMSFGGNGLVPTYGPELAAQYGF